MSLDTTDRYAPKECSLALNLVEEMLGIRYC